jgi:RimJ/RimL family protein N-acetyltransferase
MRAAVLHLGFEGLGADLARSAAFEDNPASGAVSRGLGYRENGRRREAPRGVPRVLVEFELTRDEWRAQPAPVDTEMTGLDCCLPMFTPDRQSSVR